LITSEKTSQTYETERKLAEGKHGTLIINAIRFKLILRVFACIRDNRAYETNYTPNTTKGTINV
jgi:hypothetical protein